MAKLPVLMYHSVTSDIEEAKGLTIHVDTLEQQLLYLKTKGYTTLHFKDVQQMTSASDLPKKAVIITFDDVYVNQLELAYPLFKKYQIKACYYIPFKYVNGKNEWDEGEKKIMSVPQLKQLDPTLIELGLHSFGHINYDQSDLEAVKQDLIKCEDFISNNNLNIHKTIAYPYGKYPRKGEKKDQFFNLLKDNNFKYGLRIGNRINDFPFKHNFEIQRLDIKGNDSFLKFFWKLNVGKLF